MPRWTREEDDGCLKRVVMKSRKIKFGSERRSRGSGTRCDRLRRLFLDLVLVLLRYSRVCFVAGLCVFAGTGWSCVVTQVLRPYQLLFHRRTASSPFLAIHLPQLNWAERKQSPLL
jgi:hypothetical protein